MISALFMAAPAGRLSADEGRNAGAAEMTGMRLGRHSGFLRLVFDLTARPAFDARATGANTFLVDLPDTYLPPEGHAAMAADPLAPDLVVRPADADGPLRFRLTSRHTAFIRRAFLLGPPAGGVGAGATPWRLVLDIVPQPGGGPSVPVRQTAVTSLPAPHGMEDPGPGLGQQSAPPTAVSAAAAEPPPAQVAVSWARASRILRELQDHRDPAADAALPPQLVLAPKYRRPLVPLR